MMLRTFDFVIVEYNTNDSAIHCVRSLIEAIERAQVGRSRVFLISNGAVSRDLVEAINGWEARLSIRHFCADNVGYLPALKIYYESLESGVELADVVFLMNADLCLDSQFICNLYGLKIDETKFGLIGPNIVSVISGGSQNPLYHTRPSRAYLLARERILEFQLAAVSWQILHYIKKRVNKLMSWHSRSRSVDSRPKAVYALHGSCLGLIKSFAASEPWNSYLAFLYSEELFLSEQLMRLNLGALYVPSLKVMHQEHVSTGWIRTAKQNAFQRESLQFVRETFFDD